MISRQEAEQLIGNEEGNFLVRESNNPPSSYTLAIKLVFLFDICLFDFFRKTLFANLKIQQRNEELQTILRWCLLCGRETF